jgi:hypothetical protein
VAGRYRCPSCGGTASRIVDCRLVITQLRSCGICQLLSFRTLTRQARIQHVQGIHTTLWIIVSEYPPELAGDFDRLDASLLPPTRFIAQVTN